MFRSRLILSAFLSLVAFALLFLVILPFRERTAAARKAVQDLQEERAQLKNRLDIFEQTRESVLKHKEQFQELDLLMPSGERKEEMIVILDILARENAVALESVSTSRGGRNRKGTKEGSRLSFDIDGTASYTAWKNFLHALEGEARAIDVNAMHLAPADAEGKTVQFNLSFDIFYQ